MPDLIAQGPKPGQLWRKALTGATVTLGHKDKCEWETPWDKAISRLHASLTWTDHKLHVVRFASARNPIYFQNRTNDDFTLGPGEKFVIGETTFSVEDFESTPTDEQPPREELTCSGPELQAVPYGASAPDRLEALARLPGLMRFTPSDDTFERSVLEILLAGIPGATGVALVSVNPKGAIATAEVRLLSAIGKGDFSAHFQPSRSLTREAIRIRRQPVLYSKTEEPGSGFSLPKTTKTEYDFELCAPLTDHPGLGVYIVGQARESNRKEDLKFAGLVADIFGQLRQVRDLQKRRRLLEGFMSPKVVAYLSKLPNQKADEILKPNTCNITVLFCDLRGFSRMSEEGGDLQAVCDRVSEALRIMTRNIIRADGVVGDFQGDAAMGFWGWPEETPNQVELAAGAALGILREFTQIRQLAKNAQNEFACGIGITHGPGIAGRLGTLDQFTVSVFGPVVNLASRLESLTKYFGVPILLDERAAENLSAVDPRHMRVRRLARVQPAGMTRSTLAHELLPASHEAGALSDTAHADYEAALENFHTGRWKLTQNLLENYADADGPSRVLLNYINTHTLPPKPWDGVLVMDKK